MGCNRVAKSSRNTSRPIAVENPTAPNTSTADNKPASTRRDLSVRRAPGRLIGATCCGLNLEAWLRERGAALSSFGTHTHGDRAPFSLIEADHAECAARGMAGQNSQPDIERIEC